MRDADKRRQELYGLLSDLPDRGRPVACETISVEKRPPYVREKLRLDLNGIEPVPAYFIRPLAARGTLPTVLYNHAHSGRYDVGKEELITSTDILQNPPYAVALVEHGCNALCLDHWGFGERRGRSESEIFKEMLWKGQVMWGMMVYDSLRAVDYLTTRSDVDPARIGSMGISMGSPMAWWAAALDERIKVCAEMCGMTDFEALIQTRGLDEYRIYYYVPRLLKHFTTAQINELICPRPHLCLAGNYDRVTPREGLDKVEELLWVAYAQAGVPDEWQMVRYNQGHFENPDMRRRVLEFLDTYL